MNSIAVYDFGLTKDSTADQIRAYFNRVLQLYESNEQFPINLDDVWMLVYSERGVAVKALRKNFIENEDYVSADRVVKREDEVFDQNVKNSNGGRPMTYYYLSVSCMEYLIARKVREVFNVYRTVFKKVATNEVTVLPKDYATALRELANQVERNEQLKLESKQKDEQLAAQRPKVVFADAIIGSNSSCLVGELAKLITQNGVKIGQNRLFEWLRINKFLGTFGERRNIPNQTYIEKGYFELKKSTDSENGVLKTTVTPKVTGAGQIYFINLFIKKYRENNITTI